MPGRRHAGSPVPTAAAGAGDGSGRFDAALRFRWHPARGAVEDHHLEEIRAANGGVANE